MTEERPGPLNRNDTNTKSALCIDGEGKNDGKYPQFRP